MNETDCGKRKKYRVGTWFYSLVVDRMKADLNASMQSIVKKKKKKSDRVRRTKLLEKSCKHHHINKSGVNGKVSNVLLIKNYEVKATFKTYALMNRSQ